MVHPVRHSFKTVPSRNSRKKSRFSEWTNGPLLGHSTRDQIKSSKDQDAIEKMGLSLNVPIRIMQQYTDSSEVLAGEVAAQTNIPIEEISLENKICVQDVESPSQFPGINIREEVVLFVFGIRPEARNRPHLIWGKVLNCPMEAEMMALDRRTAELWSAAAIDTKNDIMPPSWYALYLLLGASEEFKSEVKRMYSLLQNPRNRLRWRNRELVFERSIMYIRLRHEGYVLVEYPPFETTDRPHSVSLMMCDAYHDDEDAAINTIANRLNLPRKLVANSVSKTCSAPIPLTDVENVLVFNSSLEGKQIECCSVVKRALATYEVTRERTFHSAGLPVAKSALAHAAIDVPFTIKQKTPYGIHNQTWHWLYEEQCSSNVVGFPTRAQGKMDRGGRRRGMLCGEEDQEELHQAFTKKRMASILIGLEGASPGKKNSLSGASHDATGKSSSTSATGGRKWRAYAANSDVDTFPCPYGGIRCTVRAADFTEFQHICSVLIDQKEENKALNSGHRIKSSELGIMKHPTNKPRGDLERMEGSRELFRAILCNPSRGARLVLDFAMREAQEAANTNFTSASASKSRFLKYRAISLAGFKEIMGSKSIIRRMSSST